MICWFKTRVHTVRAEMLKPWFGIEVLCLLSHTYKLYVP